MLPMDMAAELERLVSGELDEQARAPLIAWLDAEPRRWRLCGLLFMESQTWSDALKEWPSQTPSALPDQSAVARSEPAPRGGWRRLREAAVLAASVLLAFVLGAAMRNDQAHRGAPSSTVADRSNAGDISEAKAVTNTGVDGAPVMAMLPIASKAGALIQPALHIPVVRGGSAATENSGDTSSVSDYVRQLWARRGYHIDIERRYLLAKLPSGQQVAVPFEQYSIQPIPPRIN
jgi:hypothetical protein